ncbi:hypothetical protein HII31_00916 [Pseudocercospora fuligena]|uniref:Uncharacterized protein n=1 Tax=Pseudocercospora fuligena TaxID=685502 RepID=A0A8H6RVT9_9PEZI|nr:hypothetical protein HII31_00916 [Pseudocercospora fuligena]
MANPPSKRRMRTLPELVQSLPQELYDQIYDETFTWTRGARSITIEYLKDFDHPPSSLLLVNRDIRSRLLYTFFNYREFVLARASSEFASYETTVLHFIRQQPSHLQFTLTLGPYSRLAMERFYSFAQALKMRGLITHWKTNEDEDDGLTSYYGYDVKFYC